MCVEYNNFKKTPYWTLVALFFIARGTFLILRNTFYFAIHLSNSNSNILSLLMRDGKFNPNHSSFLNKAKGNEQLAVLA